MPAPPDDAAAVLGLSFIHRVATELQRHQRETRQQVAMGDLLGRALAGAPLTQVVRNHYAEFRRKLTEGDYQPSRRRCPVSGEPYVQVQVDGVELDYAMTSRSLWFDAGELATFMHKDEAAEIPGRHLTSRWGRYRCPVCNERMREYQFQVKHNIMVDVCPAGHGILLEDGEFERVLALG